MKKNWLLKGIALLLIMMLVVAGCSQGGEEGKDPEPDTTNNSDEGDDGTTDDSTEAIVVKFAAQNDNTPATQAAIDAFNSSQDQYKVEWVEMTNDSGQMHDQLLNSLSSGSNEYDVLSLDVVWAGEFAGAGYLEPIDVRMDEAGYKIEDFNAGSMTSGNYKGIQYTLPFFPDLGLLYYRSDLVSEEDAAKLESGEYTYEELGQMAGKYMNESGTSYGFVFQAKQYEGLTVNATEFTNEFKDVKAGLETMYSVVTSTYVPTDILNFQEGETHTNFEQGNAVFARNWPYQYGRIKGQEDGVTVKPEQVGIAPLPNGGSVGGWLLSINKNSENIDGAWEFIQFLAGPDGQKIMSTQGGYLPGYNALLEDNEVVASNEMLSNPAFQKALSSTIARPVSPDYAQVTDTIQVNVHKYLSSGEGLDEAVQAIEAALSAE